MLWHIPDNFNNLTTFPSHVLSTRWKNTMMIPGSHKALIKHCWGGGRGELSNKGLSKPSLGWKHSNPQRQTDVFLLFHNESQTMLLSPWHSQMWILRLFVVLRSALNCLFNKCLMNAFFTKFILYLIVPGLVLDALDISINKEDRN